MNLLILGREDVQALLDFDGLIDALAEGFVALSGGRAVAPGRCEVALGDAGHLLVKPAWVPGADLTVKLVSTFYGNPAAGRPCVQGLTVLLDAANGTPLAVLEAAWLTSARTAAASALSARLLARKDARVLAIIGAGEQGAAHLKAMPRVRDFDEIRIASLYPEDARRMAGTAGRGRACGSYEEAVRGADVVCLCTSSATPVIRADWVSPGTHLTSVGYHPPGGELPREILGRGTLAVETRLAFEPPPAGCAELAGLEASRGTELGELLSGAAAGRRTGEEITVYKSMGHAVEDLVAARLVYRKALEKGAGRVVTL
jgi:ornithine cyclodeaminase/alanine dehydrogenase-like protein (mu-crystallin family)